jgi:LPS-assembly lipoprotein
MLLPLALGMLLPGCGFRPMFAAAPSGAMGPAQTGLAEINIGLIPERTGQELRQALQARFERAGAAVAPRYDLTVAFSLSGEPIGIQQDSSITRVRLVSAATWTLRAQDVQRRTLASGTAHAVDGYDTLDAQPFAGDLANDAVQRRMTAALADQITLQLAAYFDRRPES